MRTFIPMKAALSSDAADRPWRIRFQSVRRGRRTIGDLLPLLDDDDPAMQYAAAIRRTEMGDVSLKDVLIEWFLKRHTRFALRAASRIDSPRALAASLAAFEPEAR